jgi:hypothetical protein
MEMLMRLLRIARFVLILSMCIASIGSRAAAQTTRPGIIDGLVTDTALVPIEGVGISILGTPVHVETGASGRFRIQQVPPGQYLIIVRRVGFRPISGMIDVSSEETVRLAYTMERAVVSLDTMVITEHALSMKMTEFEARRRDGSGQYITQDEIERRSPVSAVDLIRTLHGIKVIPSQGGGGRMSDFAVSTRMGGTGPSACKTDIIVDGVRWPPGDLDQLPSPKQIAGIEMYPGPATLPSQYVIGGGWCGVLLIWTRDGG